MSITEKYAFVRNLLAGLISSIVFVLHVSAWTNPSTQAEFITEAGGGENGCILLLSSVILLSRLVRKASSIVSVIGIS